MTKHAKKKKKKISQTSSLLFCQCIFLCIYSLIIVELTKKKQKKLNNVITIAAVHCVLHQSIRYYNNVNSTVYNEVSSRSSNVQQGSFDCLELHESIDSSAAAIAVTTSRALVSAQTNGAGRPRNCRVRRNCSRINMSILKLYCTWAKTSRQLQGGIDDRCHISRETNWINDQSRTR